MASEPVTLQQYLAGGLLHEACRLFEEAFDLVVKSALQQEYPEDPDDRTKRLKKETQYVDEMASYQKLLKELNKIEKQLDSAIAKRNHAGKLKKEANGADDQAATAAVIAATQEVEKLKRRRQHLQVAKKPQLVLDPKPKWLEEAQAALGPKTRKFLLTVGVWDTYSLLSILQNLLQTSPEPIFRKVHLIEGQPLLRMLMELKESRNVRAKNEMPGEDESVAFLAALADLAERCKNDVFEQLNALLHTARDLVDRARRQDATPFDLPPAERKKPFQKALLLFCALDDFQKQLGVCSFEGGTVKVQENPALETTYKDRKAVAVARNWLFHRGSEPEDQVVDAMARVLTAVVGKSFSRSWSIDDLVTTVPLQLSSHGMRIPACRVSCLVDRTDEINAAVQHLSGPVGARVLIHGLPGVGKDVVAAEVVRRDEIKSLPDVKLQAWLPASTDAQLRQSLVRAFEMHRPAVVASKTKEEDCLCAISKWLKVQASEWLFWIEDASRDCTTLLDCFPKGCGRLLVTSQQPLHAKAHPWRGLECNPDSAIELKPFTVEQCIDLLLKMDPFSAHLRASDENCLEQLCRVHDVTYDAPPSAECAKARKERRDKLVQALKEAKEKAARDDLELQKFLNDDLGCLPLAVSLNGHRLRRLGSVDALIERFRSCSLSETDCNCRNPEASQHYRGLFRTTKLLIESLDNGGAAARHLLGYLALLPHAGCPESLFPSDTERILGGDLHKGLKTARDCLVVHGLATEGTDGNSAVVHQLVQRVVRELWMQDDDDGLVQQLRDAVHHAMEVAAENGDHTVISQMLPVAELCCSRMCDDTQPTALQPLHPELWENWVKRMILVSAPAKTKAAATQLKSHQEQRGCREGTVAAMHLLATACTANNEVDEALDLARRAYALASGPDFPRSDSAAEARLEACSTLALQLVDANELQEASEACEQTLEAVTLLCRSRALVLKAYASVLVRQGNLEQSKHIFSEALDTLQTYGHPLDRDLLFLQYASDLIATGSKDGGLELLKILDRSCREQLEQGNSHTLGLFGEIVRCYLECEQVGTALDCLANALAGASAIDATASDAAHHLQCLQVTALLLSNHVPEAINASERAVAATPQDAVPFGLRLSQARAYAAGTGDNPARALELLLGLCAPWKSGDPTHVGEATMEAALLFLKLGKAEEDLAMQYAEAALEFGRANCVRMGARGFLNALWTTVEMHLARTQIRQQDCDRLVHLAKEGMRLSKDRYQQLYPRALWCLARVFERRGEPMEAFKILCSAHQFCRPGQEQRDIEAECSRLYLYLRART